MDKCQRHNQLVFSCLSSSQDSGFPLCGFGSPCLLRVDRASFNTTALLNSVTTLNYLNHIILGSQLELTGFKMILSHFGLFLFLVLLEECKFQSISSPLNTVTSKHSDLIAQAHKVCGVFSVPSTVVGNLKHLSVHKVVGWLQKRYTASRVLDADRDARVCAGMLNAWPCCGSPFHLPASKGQPAWEDKRARLFEW